MTDPPAAVLGPPVPKSSFLALRDRPDAIRRARSFAGAAVFGLPYAADEIELVTVELVTNAIRAVRTLGPLPHDLWPVGVEITATARFVHLVVTDIDHRPIGRASEGGLLAESGRGLGIVDWLATTRWVVYEERRKAVHVVIAAPGSTLTPRRVGHAEAASADGLTRGRARPMRTERAAALARPLAGVEHALNAIETAGRPRRRADGSPLRSSRTSW